jgi:undecaprenyl phosphate N,N'-diacetylbacillosamine 1-phosphate transferase
MEPYTGKRTLDVLAAGTACAVLAPAAAAIALAVWLEDRGPPLFLQPRIGQGGQPFTIIKFRSMRARQVTQVGRWLRQTGLDELPQLLNVCNGDMSLVGPRPLTAADIERLGWGSPSQEWRFNVRPGITGLSQLLAGGGARASLRLDRLYLQRQSLPLDLQLIALSFAVNLIGKRPVRRVLRMIHASSLRARQPRDTLRETRYHGSRPGGSCADS